MKHFILAFVLLLGCAPSRAQLTNDPQLNQELLSTGLIHLPLRVDDARSMEQIYRQKQVLNSYEVPLPQPAQLGFATDTGKRATGSPDDPDYAIYGSASLYIDLKGMNLEGFNRISFQVYPDCPGARVVNTNLVLENESDLVKPGYTAPTGAHLVNLKNRTWNYCTLEIADYQRDCVKGLRFYTDIKGKDITTGDSARYTFRHIRLEQVAAPETTHGWMPADGQVVYSTTGYSLQGKKTALVSGRTLSGTSSRFALVHAETGQEVFSGTARREKTTLGEFGVLDFSDFRQSGKYRLRMDQLSTEPFLLSDRVWVDSEWRILNFLFSQRCGYAVPGVHGDCHIDLFSHHGDLSIPYHGGWHDAGDLSQQTLQTADITFALLEASRAEQQRNPALSARLMEEALWGLDFVLKNRYGDGFRASSMGLLIWQDGIIGSRDDIHSVRVQDMAYDNFLYAGYEAYAAGEVSHDPALQERLQQVAEEDFRFALDKFTREGYDHFVQPYEHTYNTSESQYHATISWSACQLFRLTGRQEYADLAVSHMSELLACQQTEPVDGGLNGFFWRNRQHRSVVHFIHQSREYLYAAALTEICKVLPQHPDKDKWHRAIGLYAGYIRGIMGYTAPYGMLPSGIYHRNEYLDTPAFQALHLFPPADAQQQYGNQLAQGVHLGGDYFLKRFPVWFNIYNGNQAVILSMAKGVALLGRYLGDSDLMQIAQDQLYWTVGRNPFGQSLIYGEGSHYTQFDSFSSGEITGAMPVGIRTYGNLDEPWWPTINNACYKEVWTPNAGKWLSVIAEISADDSK